MAKVKTCRHFHGHEGVKGLCRRCSEQMEKLMAQHEEQKGKRRHNEVTVTLDMFAERKTLKALVMLMAAEAGKPWGPGNDNASTERAYNQLVEARKSKSMLEQLT